LALAGVAALAGGLVAPLAGSAGGIAWLVTRVARSRPPAAPGVEELLRRREETLGELERRDAVGFTRWLATGPADMSG
jgi:hypothetical protein